MPFQPSYKQKPQRAQTRQSVSPPLPGLTGFNSYMLELIALDQPQALKVADKDFWDMSLLDEIRQSGFVEQLQKN